MLDMLFGKKKSPAEMLKQHQRALTRAQRDLDRERSKMEQQEKKLIQDIKKSAKASQMNACKIMAKDLVRTRRYIQKFILMKTQLQAVALRIQTMRSTQAMSDAMKGVSTAMKSMNKQVNIPEIQKIMTEFDKESEMMNMKEEVMNEAIDDAMDAEDEDDEEEVDQIVNQILDEIGVNLKESLVSAPSNNLSNEVIADDSVLAEDSDLQMRLNNLRKA